MRRGFFLLTWLLASSALAHGGEDHGEAPAPVASMQGEVHVLGALGDVFEVVLKHPAHGEGGKTPLRVFVAEADTNAPVSGAQVELTLTGPSMQALKSKMDAPGVYLAEADLPVGSEFVAVATVTQGELVDVLALGTVHVEPEAVAAAHAGGSSKVWIVVAGLVGLLAVSLFSWWMNRRMRRAAS